MNVTVLDEQGHPVKDLTAGDFQIFDDDRPQTVTAFRVLGEEEHVQSTTLVPSRLIS